MNSIIIDFEELTKSTRSYLRTTGYGERTIYMVNAIWRELEEFLHLQGNKTYVALNGLDFLHQRINYPQILSRKLTPDERDYIRAIRFLNFYQEHGTIPPALSRRRKQWSESVNNLREDFITFCNNNLDNPSTRKSRLYTAERFMSTVLEAKGICITAVTAKTISDYVKTLTEYSKASIAIHLRGLKFFFTFLYEKGLIPHDLTPSIPRLQGEIGERISTVLTLDQVKQLLNSIDRGNPVGKRNYAILMVAAALGLRDSDIVGLTFENIDWERCTISLFQKKTNKYLVLPLLPVVGEAIIDYLKNGRPPTDSPYLFVKHKPPFEKAVSFYGVMRLCLERSGIRLSGDAHKGLHILRHTLASELIRQGESYTTVSAILGHASIGSTNAYTHIDIEGLYKCALTLSEVTANE